MKTIDTCGQKLYSPLIPAVNDLKEYLAEQQIGFREIYDGEQMTVQFTKR